MVSRLGQLHQDTKAFETKNAIENGANEIDMVINVAALKDKQDDLVERDIRAVVDAAKGKALVTVARRLLEEFDPQRPVRLLGVRVAGLDREEAVASPTPARDQMVLAL